MSKRIITIDGPAGAGKTTISRLLSQYLGCIYVDTGALYRGVAYEIKRQNIDWKNDAALESFLSDLDLCFAIKNKALVLMSSGKDITELIRSPEISMLASSCSARPQVRECLLYMQRNIAKKDNSVFEGRDMGTIVFPDAPYKFFLFADLSIRAKRRFNEMPDEKKNLQQVQEEMKTRDSNDSQRKIAPLKPAADAIKIDASFLTIEQVVEKMMKIIEKPCQS